MDAAIGLLTPLLLIVAAIGFVLARRRRTEIVRSWEMGLLYRNSAFDRPLAPGVYTFFAPPTRLAVVRLPAVPQAGVAGPLEVASRDGFAFRLGLGYGWTIVDGPGYHQASAGRGSQLAGVALPGFSEALSAAAMSAVSAHTLAEAQADPRAIADAIHAAVAPGFPAIELGTVSVTAITLPPETRRLMSEVESARLRGLAALERARGEQAALRSLANAARLVRDNPELAQLRLLQAIETARKAPTLVLGQGAGLASLGPSPPADD